MTRLSERLQRLETQNGPSAITEVVVNIGVEGRDSDGRPAVYVTLEDNSRPEQKLKGDAQWRG